MALFPSSLGSATAAPQTRWSWWTSLFVLCAILGALIGLSFKTQNFIHRTQIPASNYPALVQEYLSLKRGLGKTVSDQQRTIAQLNDTIFKLETGQAGDNAKTRALTQDVNRAKFLAGLTPVEGPGLVVTVSDSKTRLPADAPTFAVETMIIHDTDLVRIVNELKAAQAEAVSINGQRLVATTAIRCAGPTIFINNVAQTPPYAIRAIGDPVTLENALNLPDGVADSLRRMDPAMIKIQRETRVVIPAFAGATTPKYAKPVPASGADAKKD